MLRCIGSCILILFFVRAGGPIDNNMIDNCRCIKSPPLSILRRQTLIEKEDTDPKKGDTVTKYILRRDLIGVSCSYTERGLLTIFYDILVEQESLYEGTFIER